MQNARSFISIYNRQYYATLQDLRNHKDGLDNECQNNNKELILRKYARIAINQF